MSTLEPAFFIGVGRRGRQVLQELKHQVLASHGPLPVLRWLALDVRHSEIAASMLPSTSHDLEALGSEEVFWLPRQEVGIPHTSRTDSLEAFRARAEELAGFIRHTLPALTSYEAVAAVEAAGAKVAESLQIGLYVVADLADPVGGSLAEEVAYLISTVCRQQGREPRCAGVFFLPDATQTDPAAEANAYAALKELDAHLTDPSLRRNGLPDSLSLTQAFGHEMYLVFDRGCYLLDTVNEQAYTVPFQVLVEQAALWLYCMSILDLHQTVDEVFDKRFARRSIRRKIRAYGSFGLAGYTLPADIFREWCAARLGQTIVCQGLLDGGEGRVPAGAVEGFVHRQALRAPEAMARLRPSRATIVSEEAAQYVRAGSLQELDSHLRGALRQIREADLPLWQHQIGDRTTALARQIHDGLVQQILTLMRQTSSGAVSIAREFLSQLDAEVCSQADVLAQREKEYNARHHQVIARASHLSYQLKTVLMSVPPRPVQALAALGGVLLPIAYWLAVLSAALKPQGNVAVGLAWFLLLSGVGLAIAYPLWRIRHQDRELRATYIEHLHKRAELELDPLVTHAASALYQRMREIIGELDGALDQLAHRLSEAAESMAAMERKATESLADQVCPGPWQSLLTPSFAEQAYLPMVGKLETHQSAAVEALGPLDSWTTCPANELTSQILAYTFHYFQDVSSLRISDMLRQQAPASEDLSTWLAELFNRAAPWCAFSSVMRSQTRVPPQNAHVLILDSSLDSELASQLRGCSSNIQVLNTGSTQTVTVVSMRWGLPAFALPRMNQYWVAYANALRRRDAPMHASLEELLLPELIPAYVGLPDRFTLFAVAKGLGLVYQNTTGSFHVKDGSGRSVSLGNSKETAAVLLGQWSGGARTLHRAIRSTIANSDGRAAADRLQRYILSENDLTEWERQAIQKFIVNLS